MLFVKHFPLWHVVFLFCWCGRLWSVHFCVFETPFCMRGVFILCWKEQFSIRVLLEYNLLHTQDHFRMGGLKSLKSRVSVNVETSFRFTSINKWYYSFNSHSFKTLFLVQHSAGQLKEDYFYKCGYSLFNFSGCLPNTKFCLRWVNLVGLMLFFSHRCTARLRVCIHLPAKLCVLYINMHLDLYWITPVTDGPCLKDNVVQDKLKEIQA